MRITTYGLVTLDEMLAAQKQVEDDRARKVRGVGLGHRGRPEYTWQARVHVAGHRRVHVAGHARVHVAGRPGVHGHAF